MNFDVFGLLVTKCRHIIGAVLFSEKKKFKNDGKQSYTIIISFTSKETAPVWREICSDPVGTVTVALSLVNCLESVRSLPGVVLSSLGLSPRLLRKQGPLSHSFFRRSPSSTSFHSILCHFHTWLVHPVAICSSTKGIVPMAFLSLQRRPNLSPASSPPSDSSTLWLV